MCYYNRINFKEVIVNEEITKIEDIVFIHYTQEDFSDFLYAVTLKIFKCIKRTS